MAEYDSQFQGAEFQVLGNFPEFQSQRFLVCGFLACGLTVRPISNPLTPLLRPRGTCRCLWKITPSRQAFALQPSGRKGSPAPEFMLRKPAFPRILSSGGLHFSETPVSKHGGCERGCEGEAQALPRSRLRFRRLRKFAFGFSVEIEVRDHARRRVSHREVALKSLSGHLYESLLTWLKSDLLCAPLLRLPLL